MKIDHNTISISTSNLTGFLGFESEKSNDNSKDSKKSIASTWMVIFGLSITSLLSGNTNEGFKNIQAVSKTVVRSISLSTDKSVREVNMAETKVNEKTFEEYKDGIERALNNVDKRLDGIEATLLRIESKIVDEKTIDLKLDNTEKTIRNWILITALGVVVSIGAWLFIYLFPNVDKLIKAIEAIR